MNIICVEYEYGFLSVVENDGRLAAVHHHQIPGQNISWLEQQRPDGPFSQVTLLLNSLKRTRGNELPRGPLASLRKLLAEQIVCSRNAGKIL
jgi:hypothetical protein